MIPPAVWRYRPQAESTDRVVLKCSCVLPTVAVLLQDSIEYIKTEITDMVDQICASGPHCVIRLAFVGYTDYGCPEVPHQDFSEDIGAFEKLLDTIEVSGLGINRDNAEDVFSGLQAAGKLSWTSTNRILVHVGDAPCHGQEFHEYPSGEFKDKYPDGDKLGRDAGELLLHLAETCKLDRYIFCHLSAMTKKMIQRFQQLLGELSCLMLLVQVVLHTWSYF